MSKVKFIYNYPIDLDIETDKNVEVYIDQFSMDDIPAGSIRIVILEEPSSDPLGGLLISLVQQHPDLYTHLLTFREDILATNPKARLFHCPNTWVKGYVSAKKKFRVSTVVGGKGDPQMHGYALRHEIWRNKERVVTPKEFYLSGDYIWEEADYSNELVLGASKEPLFDSMFHIAIENTSIKHYFSEKIIDCFQTRTVPIYCGCINIEEYFNIDGIIVVNDVEDIIQVCNELTPEMYNDMLPAMEENFIKSNQWCDGKERIKNAIMNLIN